MCRHIQYNGFLKIYIYWSNLIYQLRIGIGLMKLGNVIWLVLFIFQKLNDVGTKYGYHDYKTDKSTYGYISHKLYQIYCYLPVKGRYCHIQIY